MRYSAYLARRLLSLIPVWWGISFLAFGIGSLAPGDAAPAMYIQLYGQPAPNQTALDELRAEYGLDDPFWVRYGRWLGGAVQGDLGHSFASGRPVAEELTSHIGITLQIAVGGLLVAIVVAMPLGMLAAAYPNTLFDLLTRLVALTGNAMPAYWLAYILILVFAVKLQWFPVAGTGTLKHLVLPAVALGLGGSASLSRLLRSSMLEQLNQDYIRTARAKGVRERLIIWRHALRNALIPLVTIIGNFFGFLLAGAVVVETVFALPGIGRLILDAISFRDYPLIQGFVLFTGTVFVLINLLVDMSYLVIDPRVRLAEKG